MNIKNLKNIQFITRENIPGHLKDIVLITFIGFSITFISAPSFVAESWEHFWFTIIYNFTIGSTLWKGNELVCHIVFALFPVDEIEINKKLVISIVVAMIYTVICSLGINWLWINFYDKGNFIAENLIILVMIQIFITIIITSIFISIGFYRYWKESLLEQGKLKAETLELQLQSLKNQVNPHFLFNSLNTLTSLVEADQAQAVKYIKKLSDVYRYILEYRDEELITVESELKSVESFIYLQKIRFGENFSVFVDELSTEGLVIPLSIQMLIENAIKHNIISIELPLKINIYEDGNNYLVVKNNLQRKTSVSTSNLVGLKNLKARYEYITHRPFIIDETITKFIVKVPLIKAT